MPREEAVWPRRRSIRLAGFDYALNCSYYITICSHRQQCIFGHISGTARLSPLGQIVADEWKAVPSHRPYLHLEASVVMPNHVHLLFTILRETDPNDPNERRRGVARYARDPGRPTGPTAHSVGAIIRGFKSQVTHRARTELGIQTPIWQRSFYDTIIENDRQFLKTLDYIRMNPERWMEDRYNPEGSRRA